MQICVLTCSDQVDDPQRIADGMPAALAELVAHTEPAPDSVNSSFG